MTQYAYLNDSVSFECATNLTGYTLNLIFGMSVPPSLRIVLLSNGGQMLSADITATIQSNGSCAICYANLYETEKACLYVQGQFLQCSLKSTMIHTQVLLIVLVTFKGIS